MVYIDTHVHIDFYPNPHQLAQEYEQLKIYALFVTNLPEIFEKHLKSFANYKYVRLCLGYHPQVASEYPLNESLFKDLVNNTRYIGEVGLDFVKEHQEIKYKQIKAFEYVTSPFFNKGRVYSIHTKQSEDMVLDILLHNKVKHAIFHWYSGKLSTLEKIVDNGYYFSLNPKMLQTKNGQKIISKIPIKNILFETDGPFVHYNKKVIRPSCFPDIYKEFSECVYPDFEKQVFKNFRRLLIEKDLY